MTVPPHLDELRLLRICSSKFSCDTSWPDVQSPPFARHELVDSASETAAAPTLAADAATMVA
eukprot:CAMPEP_0177343334 /NCGR_PEP_ID=MMETSP0368-20130122/27521_1 /TAXON_ID=447022 ORGANISM="Scrippsiella hangoei-like, Strain SHHI-4" /NCGR_SAMPLE_ID=MMETSP0368 /ASSEMBLY_ACC=CAM_ASM_000363 /LENGTH=61 /DNA_ID=CAMNT_0018804761 /DNA_START=169 /DNA_END=351 /DNA_ORIENTATION=-